LSVFRSNRHIHAQLIDDSAGRTIAAVGTQQSTLADGCGSNKVAAQLVGKAIAAQALANGLSTVCFDRGCYRYHGRVKALADAAREAGLKF
jgi:large subunit ribosomal protein L18